MNAEDALNGSGNSLELCEGDMYIVKSLCHEAEESQILSISLDVKLVSTVKIYLLNVNGTNIGGPIMVNIYIYSLVTVH